MSAIVTLYEEAADLRTTNEKMLRQVDFLSKRTELVKALAPATNPQSRCLDLMARVYDDMARGNVRRYHAPFFLIQSQCMHKECRPFPLPPLYHHRTDELVPAPPPATSSSPDTAETDTKEVSDTVGGET